MTSSESPAENRSDEHRAAERAKRRQYNERNKERIAEYKRTYRERNADHIREYRRAYRAEHLEEIRAKNREGTRARAAKDRADRAPQEKRRVRAREWYAENTERHLDAQRAYRAAQRERDPEGYRKAKAERTKRWRDKHLDRENAKLRAKYRDDPSAKQAAAARYYEKNAEAVKARRRAYYAANREKQLATQQKWREREGRRKEAGLPPRRIHKVTLSERGASDAEAKDFFAREWSSEQIEQMKAHQPTPNVLIARLERDNARARAEWAIANRPLKEPNREAAERAHRMAIREEAQRGEEARLDAIAREVNERLRTQPRQHRPSNPDQCAPHAAPGQSQSGLGL
ncbi:hypothetical protein ACWPKO_29875 (plasmid) [Coraliomargarita sp. W4R53]